MVLQLNWVMTIKNTTVCSMLTTSSINLLLSNILPLRKDSTGLYQEVSLKLLNLKNLGFLLEEFRILISKNFRKLLSMREDTPNKPLLSGISSFIQIFLGTFAYLKPWRKEKIPLFCYRYRPSTHRRLEISKLPDPKTCRSHQITNRPHMFQCPTAAWIRIQVKTWDKHQNYPWTQPRFRTHLICWSDRI